MKSSLLKLTALLLFLSAINASAAPWELDVAPYLWATNMHGSVQIGSHKMEISQSFSDILKHFQGGGMLFLNARKNKAVVFFNAMYSVLEESDTIANIPLSVRNNFGIFSAGLGYQIFEASLARPDQHIAVELLAGARHTLNNTRLNVGRFAFSNKENWTDPTIGSRIHYDITKNWQTMFEGDAGGANHHNSYNLQAYLGYQPSKPWVFEDLVLYLGYRFLHQHYQTGQDRQFYAWNMDISGPVIGVKAVF